MTLRTALALLLAPAFAACDTASPDPAPAPDPGPATAAVAIALGEVTVPGDCDDGANPGDFQFKVAFLDEGNQSLGEAREFPASTYGTNAGASALLEVGSGRAYGLGQTATLQRPRQDGSGFTVVFSTIEWDSATARDARMNDRTSQRLYVYRDGRFGGITGPQSIGLRGSSDCEVRLSYTITVQ